MNAAQGPAFQIRGDVRLRYDWFEAVRDEFLLTKNAGERSAGIFVPVGFDDIGPFNFVSEKIISCHPSCKARCEFTRAMQEIG